jgi:ankyrin repeat protein
MGGRHPADHISSSLPWELLQQAKQQDFGETALREKRIEILKLLNTTPYRDRKDRNPDRIQGTCEWFTEHELFLDWQQAKTSRLLWVSADPGCGKSVLAKYLVDSVLLTTASRATCYFFFKDDFEDQRGVVGALCCILHQLFMQKRTLLSERILERFEISGEKFDRSFSELWDILLSIAEDPNAGEIVCILDAIDECEDQGRTQLVQALCKLYGTRTNFNLKFLLTSRPYGGIRRDFQSLEIPGMPIIHLSGENDTEMEKISKEIDIFIKARVQGIGAKLKLTTEEEGLLLEGLMRVPNRTYLWVHLTLDLIESDPDIDKYGIVKATHNLPKTIDEAYDRILCKSRNFTEAKKLLHIVVAAERPLTLKEMSLALALRKYHKSYTDVDLLPEDRFRENVRDLCGLFITVNDSRIYLLHQTSKEFLVQIAFTVPPQHIKYDGLEWKESLRPQVSHGILAEICIQRLLFAECESHPVKKDGMSSQYTDSHVFLDYSAKHWAAHLQDSYGENDIATDLILKLCDAKSNRCLTWLRIYWTSTNTDFPENFNDLMIASYFGLTALVKQKLRRGDIDLDSKDSTYGRSALSWAAENGSYAIVKLLLKAGTSSLKRIMSFRKGAKVDSTDRYGRTPLSYAAWNGHVAVVKLLLKSGARVDTMDEIGGTPLSYAVVNGHDTVVNLLLNKETNIDSEDNISKTLMFEAAKKRHDAVVKLLLEKGVDLEEKDSSDRTPLSWAAGNGHETVVKLLLQEGADIESKDTSHRTPLSRAAENGHVTVVKLLLENGAQFEYKDIAAQNPLLRAAINGRKAVVGLLLEKGAALEVKDQFDRTPLIWAARNGYDLVVKLLLEKGAVVEFQDSFGQSPLLWAAKNGRDAVVELLLSKNGDSESKDKTGRTPLSWAAGDGHKEVVEVLLKKGADSESKDQYGKTPLSWAIENGDEQMVRLFLGKDADNPDSPELKRVRQIKQENATVAECKMLLLGMSSVRHLAQIFTDDFKAHQRAENPPL